MCRRYPDVFELALGTDDIDRIRGAGKIASLIGVEGGHSIENSINVLRQLYKQGARYMTLTHSKTLDWADSCSDQARNHGLSAFGEQVVLEMNRLGMLVDISHVSADCMRHTLRIAKAPIIFSHSSARAVADHPRNVPDDVLEMTRQNGGVVMINFFNDYVNPIDAERSAARSAKRKALNLRFPGDPERVNAELRQWEASHPRSNRCTVHDVVDHVEHVIKHAGIDHVGLGSDFDGVPVLPRQLEDVSTYPVITQALLDRGYREAEIKKILGGNALRVFREAERVAGR
jgi:membrane dipeptidase